jgi:hypothetical protein
MVALPSILLTLEGEREFERMREESRAKNPAL